MVTYAITVCDELNELKTLLKVLEENEIEDVIILKDEDKSSLEMDEYLEYISENSNIKVFYESLNKDFATFKNNILKHTISDYIFQIDADEIPSENILKYLPFILEENSDVDCFNIPRRNIVEGITEEHIRKWGWRMDENGYINPFDPQMRLFKNNGNIKWVNKVHEKLIGYKRLSILPNDFFLWHIKDIKKQELQNKFYETI